MQTLKTKNPDMNRRYTDTPGVDVDHERDRRGFALRLLQAEPGSEILVRGDILDIVFIVGKKDTTLRKIVDVLVNSGKLESTENPRSFQVLEAVHPEGVISVEDPGTALSILKGLLAA